MSQEPPSYPFIPDYDPLVWLPPEIGQTFVVSQLLYAATMGAYAWDVLLTLNEDYRLLFKHRIGLPTVAYFISRISVFAYIITSFVFQATAVSSCLAASRAITIAYAFASPSTSAIFYLRTVAVYGHRKWVIIVFGLLWLGTLAGGLLVVFAVQGGSVANTGHCVNVVAKGYASAAPGLTALNDTFVWLAVSAKLFHNVTGSWNPFRWIRQLTTRRDMPAMTREIMEGGMAYYFATIASNVITFSLIASTSLNPVIRSMFTIPNLALTASMAGRVFRGLKLSADQPKLPTQKGGHLQGSGSSPHATASAGGFAGYPRGSCSSPRQPLSPGILQMSKLGPFHNSIDSNRPAIIKGNGTRGARIPDEELELKARVALPDNYSTSGSLYSPADELSTKKEFEEREYLEDGRTRGPLDPTPFANSHSMPAAGAGRVGPSTRAPVVFQSVEYHYDNGKK